jgi:hypothetical protein
MPGPGRGGMGSGRSAIEGGAVPPQPIRAGRLALPLRAPRPPLSPDIPGNPPSMAPRRGGGRPVAVGGPSRSALLQHVACPPHPHVVLGPSTQAAGCAPPLMYCFAFLQRFGRLSSILQPSRLMNCNWTCKVHSQWAVATVAMTVPNFIMSYPLRGSLAERRLQSSAPREGRGH